MLNQRCVVIAMSCFVSVTLASIMSAQDRIDVASDIRCPECTVEIQHVATLGGADEPASVFGAFIVKRDSRGRLYAAPASDRASINVYGPTGKFLRRIGRPGGGPGEFRAIMGLEVGADDGLWVYDVGNGRRTVLSKEYEVVATHHVSFNLMPNGTLLLPDSAVVVNAVAPTMSGIGLPLHVLDSAGSIVRSFGTDDTNVSPRSLFQKTRRVLAAAGHDTLWSAFLTKYVIEMWALDGKKVMEVRRNADWFPPYEEAVPLTPDKAPQARLRGIHADLQGRLWCLIQVADDRWRDNIDRRSTADGEQYLPARIERVYDTIIEVIDLRRREVVARTRVDAKMQGFADASHPWSLRSVEDGSLRIDVWRVRLADERGP